MTNEQAQKVARRWADHLRKGATFSTLTPRERQDPANRPAMMAELIATMARPMVPPEQANAFEQALFQLITDKERPITYLYVDYHPDNTLARALQQAGISSLSDVLPWKSQTEVEGSTGRVRAKQGMGGAVLEL